MQIQDKVIKKAVKQYRLIGRGFAGWHGEGIDSMGNEFSSSGGYLEDYTYWTGEACFGYLSEAVEGCLVYDAEHLDTPETFREFHKWVYNGPMVGLKLKPGEVNKLFAGVTTDPGVEITGSDFVSADDYIKLLKERVPGVKTGFVCDGQIVWE